MADAHTQQHDYHLVDPSPWPIIGSVSAFVMAVGAITWMHHMFSAAPLVFGAGVIGVLYTFISWWRDVINEAARPITASAAYNVTPLTMGAYFQKINCFCFTEQHLAAGEKREMAVVFFVDPALAKDSDQDDLNTITLSYTFYPQREPYRPVADSTLPGQGKIY